jgi:hypothetical protein
VIAARPLDEVVAAFAAQVQQAAIGHGLSFNPFPFDQKYRNSFKSKACGYKHPQTPPLSGKGFFPKLQTFGRP